MWKKFGLLTGAALPAAFTPALGADLPARAPAPAPVFTVAPFSWNGFYVGVNAGLISAKTQLTGYEPSVDAGYCWSGACDYRSSNSETGGLFGAQIGYNFQTGAFVIGVEADIGFVAGADTSLAGSGPDYTFGKTGLSSFGTARLRLGYAFDRALLYVTGGLAFAKSKDKLGDANYAYFNGNNGISSAGIDNWRTGWTLGAGVEYAINNNWSVKAEGLYYDLGTKSGISTLSTTGYQYNEWQSGIKSEKTGVVARLGLNYRFGGGSSAPVMARY